MRSFSEQNVTDCLWLYDLFLVVHFSATLSAATTGDIRPCDSLCCVFLPDPYLFLKLRGQRVFCKNVEGDLLDTEQESRFDHGKGLIQTIPTGHHSQVHDLLRPCALGHRTSHVTP